MESTIDIKQARTLIRDQRRWPLIMRFLYGFAGLVDADRVAKAAGSLAVQHLDSPQDARYVLECLGVTPLFHDFPAEDGSRLLLMPAERYLQLAQWLGALAHAKELKLVVDGALVRQLKQQLPGIFPEVLKVAPYFHAWPIPALPETDFTIGGLRLLSATLNALPDGLMARQRLRFPESLDAGFVPADAPVELPMVYRLLELVLPEEYALCCS